MLLYLLYSGEEMGPANKKLPITRANAASGTRCNFTGVLEVDGDDPKVRDRMFQFIRTDGTRVATRYAHDCRTDQ